MNFKKNIYRILVLLTLIVIVFSIKNIDISAKEYSISSNDIVVVDSNPERIIKNEDREIAYMHIVNYMNQLKTMYDLSEYSIKKMDEVFYQTVVYVANNNITVAELNELVIETKSNIHAVIGETSNTLKTENFIFMSSDIGIASGVYGQPCTVTIGLINLGGENIKDIVVTPVQDVDPQKWPFAISTASDAKIIKNLSPAGSIEDGKNKKQVLSWTFNVSDTALTGTYPIPFKVQYYSNGVMKETTITTYANITAKYGNGKLIKEDENDSTTSTPRIIVTGFSTEPDTVYAGDTFTLSVYVQNTSSNTRVSNIQFDLKAASSGAQGSETVDAFLPTSGSSTVYIDSIAPKESAIISMEMTARNDLSQKPYVITLSSKYEGKKNQAYEATANISIPVNQEAKIDFSDGEVMPGYISVGDMSNIMFDIYNKGKTTVYNVQISFDDGYVTGGTAFVGKIEPGSTGSVDVEVTGNMSNIETGNVVCTITYEDQSGQVITTEKILNLTVDEAYVYDDAGYEDEYMYDDAPVNEGPSPVIFIIIGIVAVVAIIVVTVLLVKKNKAKKARLLKELEDNDDGNLL